MSAFRTSYRTGDRSFANSSPREDLAEKISLQSLEIITDALLEIKEVRLRPFTRQVASRNRGAQREGSSRRNLKTYHLMSYFVVNPFGFAL